MYGFESWDEPLLTLWAERVVDVDQVPRVIRDVQEVRADLVTSTLTLRFDTLGIQSPCQRMIGVYNHHLRKASRFDYYSQKVIGSLGTKVKFLNLCKAFFGVTVGL